jgi:hypothetical protein
MKSLFQVTASAPDRSLLTLPELRATIGIPDHSEDAALQLLGNRLADRIARACKVGIDGATPPTLREETILETFRLGAGGVGRARGFHHFDDVLAIQDLVLGRRPIVSVASIVEDCYTLDADDFEIHSGAGMLLRLWDDFPACWLPVKVVVGYTAGWATVPDGLRTAAERLARYYWFRDMRDPALKQISLAGIGSRSFESQPATDPDVPADVMDMLAPFVNTAIG